MCGIYAVSLENTSQQGVSNTGGADAAARVFAGLKRLEYRGYDSWGVATVDQNTILVDKHAGKMAGVERANLPSTSIALGHTRWATHGGITDVNAHPHLSSDGSFALVQNGEMENYQEVKDQLLAKGYTFVSQTDTEVIVHLIEEIVKEEMAEAVSAGQNTAKLDFAKVAKAFSLITGRNTIALLTAQHELFAIRDGSPLVLGRGSDGYFLSSDVLSLSGDAHEFIALESGQGVSVSGEEVHVYEASTLDILPAHWSPIDVTAQKIDKEGFDHFMLKEIFEQTRVLSDVVRQDGAKCSAILEMLAKARQIYCLGSGGASFSATFMAHVLRQYGFTAIELKAYEARSYVSVFSKDDLCIAVSQSGESADTVEVVEWMKKKRVKIVSLVNMPGSTLERLADLPFPLQVGPEIGVASTKAMSGQMTWGLMVGGLLEGQTLTQIERATNEYEDSLKLWMTDKDVQQTIQQLSKEWVNLPELYVLGRGALYASMLEFALKLKEISYIHAEGFSGGELKHGPLALIQEGSVVVCLIAENDEKADMLNAAAQAKARGARVIGVASENNQLFDTWIRVPSNQRFAPISAFIPAQLLTYYTAVAKGLDPDKPRNLAKSVTVK